jgi:light-regulated signal transduction histidine kinase (bacteriophytochrome)
MIMNAPRWGNTPDNYGEIYRHILELHPKKSARIPAEENRMDRMDPWHKWEYTQ